MSHLPRITVITPSLNQGRYLERAICSVLDQGYENLQFIVIDGGSADESVALTQHYDDQIAYWHSCADRGPGDAINQALALATGDYVCILPADGVMPPGALHEAAEHLRGDAWYLGRSLRINVDDEPVGSWSPDPGLSLGGFLLGDQADMPISASFFRRGVIEENGGFDHTARFAFGYEMVCRLLASGVTPIATSIACAAHREARRTRSVTHLVREGEEFVVASERYSDMLTLRHRHDVLESCEQRRRIYAIAAAESGMSDTRRFLWQQLLRRPTWLCHQRYREALLRGASEESLHAAPERIAA